MIIFWILFLLDIVMLYSSQFFLYQKNKSLHFFPSGLSPTKFMNPESICPIECHIEFLFSIIINDLLSTSSFFLNFIYLFIYLIYGCVGSSFLCEGFL